MLAGTAPFLGVTLAALAAIPLAGAQVVTTGTFGAWTAIEGRAEGGARMCGIYARGRDRSFYIKYFDGEPNFTIQVFKTSWNVPQPTPVRVRLELGPAYLSHPLNGTAYPPRNGAAPLIELSMQFENSSEFWSALRLAAQGRLHFLTGNEGSWSISLNGSNAAVSRLASCIRGMDRPTRGASAPPSTQPFGATPRGQGFDKAPEDASAITAPAPNASGTPARSKFDAE